MVPPCDCGDKERGSLAYPIIKGSSELRVGPVVFSPILLQLLGQLMHLPQLHEAGMLVQDLGTRGHLDQQGVLAPCQLP